MGMTGRCGAARVGKSGNQAAGWALATASALALMQAQPAIAQGGTMNTAPVVAQAERTYAFDIPAKPLPQAIADFSAVTGLQVLYTERSTFDHTAPALRGNYTARQALDLLVGGSGLIARFTSANAVTIERPGNGSDAIVLGPIVVEGTSSAVQRDTEGAGYAISNSSTATKTSQPIIETPQAIQVIPQDVLDDEQATSLDEALARVSSITQDNTFGNTTDSFKMRGFELDDSLYRDGVRSTFVDRNYDATVDRVEVLKGPSSLLYGRQEPGGMVNVITKKPLDTHRYEGAAQFSTTGKRNGFVDFTGPIAEVGDGVAAYRLVVEREHSDYWRNFGEIRETLFAPSLAYNTNNFRADITYKYSDRDVPFDRGTVIIDGKPAAVPRDRRFGEDFEKATEQAHAAAAKVEYDLTPNITLRASGALQLVDRDRIEVRPLAVDSAGNLARRIIGDFGRYADRYYASANVIGRFETGPIGHEVLVGADWETEEGGSAGGLVGPTSTDFNIFQPVYGQLDPSAATFSPFTSRSEAETYGYYIQDILSLTEQFKVLVGGRYEQFRRYQEFNHPTLGNVVTDDSEGDVFLPRAGAVFRPIDWLAIYASYSESFQPNSSTPERGPLPASGPFDPEQGVAYETGLKTDFPNGLTSTIAIYHITKQNVLASENGVLQAVGEVRSRGVEADLSGNITPELSFIASYSYNDAVIVENGGVNEGNRFTNVPKQTAALFGRYDIKGGGLEGLYAGGGLRYVGKRAGDSANSFFLEDYLTVDLFGGYDLHIDDWPRISIQLNVKNLLDREYYPSSGGNLRINVGEPRTFFLQGSMAF